MDWTNMLTEPRSLVAVSQRLFSKDFAGLGAAVFGGMSVFTVRRASRTVCQFEIPYKK
jgi:hypothetical protein